MLLAVKHTTLDKDAPTLTNAGLVAMALGMAQA